MPVLYTHPSSSSSSSLPQRAAGVRFADAGWIELQEPACLSLVVATLAHTHTHTHMGPTHTSWPHQKQRAEAFCCQALHTEIAYSWGCI